MLCLSMLGSLELCYLRRQHAKDQIDCDSVNGASALHIQIEAGDVFEYVVPRYSVCGEDVPYNILPVLTFDIWTCHENSIR